MNKNKIIISVILLLFISSLWWSIYYFKDKIFKKETQIVNTWTWKTVDSLILDNYSISTQTLNLWSKRLWKIPDICSMVKWTTYQDDIWNLDLSNNWIEFIDQDLSCLWNLWTLDLSFNLINKIENLDKLTFLNKLDLSKNKISEIQWLDNLNRLQDLHIWYNKVISASWLEKNTNLVSLKLQHNLINDLSWLKNLTNLEELKLEFNDLEENDLKSIQNLKKLKIITIWENKKIRQEIIDKFNQFSLKSIK